jgi:hypothetical protein
MGAHATLLDAFANGVELGIGDVSAGNDDHVEVLGERCSVLASDKKAARRSGPLGEIRVC